MISITLKRPSFQLRTDEFLLDFFPLKYEVPNRTKPMRTKNVCFPEEARRL